MKVTIHYLGIERRIKFSVGFENKIKWLIENENRKLEEIAIIFTDNQKILEVNVQYLNHHYFTDIITFDYGKRHLIKGDLYISLEQVQHNAGMLEVSFLDEVIRVIIHGILHLIGYDDQTEEQKDVMRKKEDVYLCGFKNPDCISTGD